MTKARFLKMILIIGVLLTMTLTMTACGEKPAKTGANGYADQTAFLKDMAKGIQNRLAAVDDEKHANDTDEQMAEYRKALVKCELDQIEKYEDAVFEDSKFNELAHHYIHACKMQYSGASNIKSTTLYTALWNGGSTVRSGIIVTMYEQYDLPIDSNAVANYKGGTGGYTITFGTTSNSSKKEFDREAVEKKLSASYAITKNDTDVVFLENGSDEIINVGLTIKFYKGSNLVSSKTNDLSNVLPGQHAAAGIYVHDIVYDRTEVEISSISRSYLELSEGTSLDELVEFSVTPTSGNAIISCHNKNLAPSARFNCAIVFYSHNTPVWCESTYAYFSVDLGKTETKDAALFGGIKEPFDDVQVFVSSFYLN